MPSGTKPPIPVGYAKAVQHGRFGPANWVNVFYFLVAPTGSPTLLQVMQDIAFQVHEYYNALGFGNFANVWTIDFVKVGYRDATNDMARATIADADVGVGSGGSQDAQVSYLINYDTLDPRRGGKPRQYICGVPDFAVADSARLDSTIRAAMNTGLAEWFVDLSTGEGTAHATILELVEMSFVNAKAYRTDALPYGLQSGSVNSVVATQRRRVNRLRV